MFQPHPRFTTTPAPWENKSSLEDLVGAFIVQSRNRTSKLEDAVTTMNNTVSGQGVAIKNMETQLGQLVSVVSTMQNGRLQ